MGLRVLLLLCLLPLCAACAGPARPPAGALSPAVPALNEPPLSIYVIPQGLHTGIALRPVDIPPGLVPEQADFPATTYLEIGWGDWNYYQAVDPGVWMLLGAAFPGRSVLHVVGVEGTLSERFPGLERVRIELDARKYTALANFLHASFERNGAARAVALGPGHRRNSRFYPATGTFHLLNNCNTWVALALEAAGLPLGRPLPFTAEQLMARVRQLAAIPQDGQDTMDPSSRGLGRSADAPTTPARR